MRSTRTRPRTASTLQALADPNVDLSAPSRKIKGAVRTANFILSAKIVVITLGTVAAASLGQHVAVLVGISLLTVGVYGLVAGIVKLVTSACTCSAASAFTRVSALPSWGSRLADERCRWSVPRRCSWSAASCCTAGPSAAHAVGILRKASAVAGRRADQHRRGRTGMGIVAGAIVLAAVMFVQKLRSAAPDAEALSAPAPVGPRVIGFPAPGPRTRRTPPAARHRAQSALRRRDSSGPRNTSGRPPPPLRRAPRSTASTTL